MIKQNERPEVGKRKGSIYQTKPTRLWFLGLGCKPVPLEYTRNNVQWGHPDGYFLNAQGQKIAHSFSPYSQKGSIGGSCYPVIRQAGSKLCHILMALAFYGERPTYTSASGKTYVGICHHLIPDKLDYKPANLLCWLTREQHTEADRRQRALRKILPDMHDLSYDDHRRLQDPRVTSSEAFVEFEIHYLRKKYGTKDNI